MVGMPRQAGGVQPPHGGPGGVPSAGPNGAGPGGYLGNQQQQQQAAMMKQMMAMEQEKRVQLHLIEQHKVQLLREQRQQQHHHLLAEQVCGMSTSHRQQHFLRPPSVSDAPPRLKIKNLRTFWYCCRNCDSKMALNVQKHH